MNGFVLYSAGICRYTFFALHTLCGNNSGKPFTKTDHEHETGNKIIVLSGKQLIKV